MKIHGLTCNLAAATLFLALASGLRAEDVMTPASAEKRPATKAGASKGNRAAEMLQRYDKNGDGRIDDDERIDAREAMRSEQNNRQMAGGSPEMRARVLAQFDKNKDGRLDESERAEMRKALGDRLAENPQVLQRFDKNGDGKLDESERAAARAAMQQRMKAGPAVKAGKGRQEGKAGKRSRGSN